MCMASQPSDGGASEIIQQQQQQIQLLSQKKGTPTLPTAATAKGAEEKVTKTNKVSSLRVPIKNKQAENVGVNTADESALGLNIPTV